MPHTYQAQTPPGIQLDSGITQFFEDFYKTSDTPDAHEKYANSFTKDATLVMVSKKGVGRDEILEIRKGMWAAVSSRLHSPLKIFPFGKASDEVMLFGTVAFTLKDGRKSNVEWAARAKLVKEGEEWKMGFYQVYLDSAAMQNAK